MQHIPLSYNTFVIITREVFYISSIYNHWVGTENTCIVQVGIKFYKHR
jgi:hypothetical protein